MTQGKWAQKRSSVLWGPDKSLRLNAGSTRTGRIRYMWLSGQTVSLGHHLSCSSARYTWRPSYCFGRESRPHERAGKSSASLTGCLVLQEQVSSLSELSMRLRYSWNPRSHLVGASDRRFLQFARPSTGMWKPTDVREPSWSTLDAFSFEIGEVV